MQSPPCNHIMECMRNNPLLSKFSLGEFVQSPFLSKLTLLLCIGSLAWVTLTALQQYHKITLGKTCQERLQIIENAKKKFKAVNPDTEVTRYSDLLPHIKYTGFPMCPWGGTYSNERSLKKPTACSCNGDPTKEPLTPQTNPMKNGYCDLYPQAPTQTVFTDILSAINKAITYSITIYKQAKGDKPAPIP